MCRMNNSCNYVMLASAAIIAFSALILVAISFATDYWIITDVDRSALFARVNQGGPGASSLNTSLTGDPVYYSRNRGLFRTCFDGESVFLGLIDQDDIVDGNCLRERGYEIDGKEKRVRNDDDYDTRIHLMRSHFAFFVVAIVLLFITIILSIVGCWRYQAFPLRGAAICCLGAMLFTAAGIAFFHGYDYLEKEKINQMGFPRFYNQMELLDRNSDRTLGYSYIIAWLGVGFALIAGFLYLCVAWNIRSEKGYSKSDSLRYLHHSDHEHQPKTVVIPPESIYGGGYNQGPAMIQAPSVIPSPGMVHVQPPIQPPIVQPNYAPAQPLIYGHYA